MSELRRCPQCDAEIPANSPAGLCPRCLLKASADSQSAAASADPGPTQLTPPNSGFVPPTVEELAPLFPQLEILELLGKGGMGAVYKARQPGLDRFVALKILPPEISHDPAFAERFQREARALAKLSHPHIVAVYDFGVVDRASQPDALASSGQAGKPDLRDGLCYFVMEFVDGANLRQAIKAGKLAPAEALAIIPQICEALQFAHDEGIVHRDIKPENILIDKRGRVKIADFGLAKLLGQNASDHSLTATHQVMGTLRYMAPEQMQGSREVDHRADIYSLGVVFYELLTGELPMGKFAPPSKKVQIDVRLDEVVLRALEQDPEQRYQHASDVKSVVETITSTPSPRFMPVRSPSPAVVSDQVMFRRLTGANLITGAIWVMLLAGLHAGYLAGADWYFKQELPYEYLTGFWKCASVLLAYWMIYWWYLLAKQPDAPRSFQDFMATAQRPDPRVKRLWKPAVVIVASYLLVTVLSLPYGDAAQSTVMTAAFGSLPFAVMFVMRRCYSERFPQDDTEREPPAVSYGPRFSRFAIAGAVWAIFGLLTVIPVLYFIGLNRVWNGTALPTDVIHSEPPLVFTIFMGTLLAIGSGAPIGTTIFGSRAIGDIKRSEGKLIGLPLAFADAVFFPLLGVFVGIAWLVAQTIVAVTQAKPPSAEAPGALVALAVCFFIARALWRAISPQLHPFVTSATKSEPTEKSSSN